MSYSLTYTVTAATEYEAITAAVAMLRTDVRLRGVNSAREVAPGMWEVSLNLEEVL